MTQPAAPVAAPVASVHAWWAPYITAQARARGLDPKAVLAVASREGLSGGVGDGGHAFGPFQMNDAGGVLTGRPGNHRAYAEGKVGINAALDGMSSARGLRGDAAIKAIVTNFERPLHPGQEIAGAIGAYGHQGVTTPGVDSPTAPPLLGATDPSLGTPNGDNFGLPPNGVSSVAQGAAALRQQAIKGFSDVAAGGSAEDSFAHMAHFVNTMKTTLPQIHPATMALAQAAPDGLEAQAVKLAQKYIGVKYTWGGTTPKSGFDCSGLVQHVWGALGKAIPRTTYAQWDGGTPVANNDLKPGDAVFFTGADPLNGKPGHEGLYIGQGKFIEAPHTGTVVQVSSLAGRTDFVGARRFG